MSSFFAFMGCGFVIGWLFRAMYDKSRPCVSSTNRSSSSRSIDRDADALTALANSAVALKRKPSSVGKGVTR